MIFLDFGKIISKGQFFCVLKDLEAHNILTHPKWVAQQRHTKGVENAVALVNEHRNEPFFTCCWETIRVLGLHLLWIVFLFDQWRSIANGYSIFLAAKSSHHHLVTPIFLWVAHPYSKDEGSLWGMLTCLPLTVFILQGFQDATAALLLNFRLSPIGSSV